MSSRTREAGRSTAHHAPTAGSLLGASVGATPADANPAGTRSGTGTRPARAPVGVALAADRSRLPLVALFTVGALPAYLAPCIVSRVTGELQLTAAQAGVVGTVLLLASALAGIALAGRVAVIGGARLAQGGLVLLLTGFTAAGTATVGAPALLLVGCLLGGLGAGTAAAVAATGIASSPDPHRTTVLGLLATSAAASTLYLLLPRLGSVHALPFLALALTGALAFPLTLRLPATPSPNPNPTPTPTPTPTPDPTAAPHCSQRLPRRAAGLVLAGSMVLWSLAQNALWGVSGQIGQHRVGLTEQRLGLVFAVALGAGLVGVLASGVLADRAGRVVPVGLGTATIAVCVTVSADARSAAAFAGGEVLWNALYPLVFSYLIGVAAALDPTGRWTVLTGAASALGLAGGPLAGATLVAGLGCPLLAAVLGGTLLLTAVPLALVARTVEAAPAFAGRPVRLPIPTQRVPEPAVAPAP
ncbi:MFS transporter [Kitasatospora azatica]|uniref:MFS transporter n=1 Tax=Kitasatospora azatica TaxID=58347 RepID=UPI0007C7959A|nr:MFS transporter [Kitasatospora azatica]